MTDFYCMKCKVHKQIENPEKVTTKNGRSALRSDCPDCKTKLYRFVKES